MRMVHGQTEAARVLARRPRVPVPIPLPQPRSEGLFSVERCLRMRRSNRNYSEVPLQLHEVSQLLWAAQGVTGPGGLRACPSPRALYPLRVDLVCGSIQDLSPGIYRYDPDRHALSLRVSGDRRRRVSHAALDQQCANDAAAVVAISVCYRGLVREFGDRGMRLAPIEAGHAGENVCLQATALDLAVVGMGVFDDRLMAKALSSPESEEPLYLIATGHKL